MNTARHVSTVIAVALALVSLLGLALGTRGLYADDPATAPAFLGQDVVTLVLALPALVLAQRATSRGSLAGLVVWMGMLFYVAYSYAFYVLDPHTTPLFPVYAAVVALSVYALVALLVGPAADQVRDAHAFDVPRRAAAIFLGGMGSMFLALWLALFVARLAAGRQPTMVEHVVWSLDFMFALPAMLLAGYLLWRRAPWGTLLGGMMLVKASLLGFTLLASTAAATMWHVRPDAGQTAMFAVLAFAGLAILVVYVRALSPATSSPRRTHARLATVTS